MEKENEMLIVNNSNNSMLIDARLLHRELRVTTRFNDWIRNRIQEFGFKEDEDFYSNLSKNQLPEHSSNFNFTKNLVKLKRGRKPDYYMLSIDMAKELAMLERNEVGRAVRRYFIETEKQYRDWIGFVFPKLKREQSLFNGGYYFDYIELLRSCNCSIVSGSVRARMKKNPQEFYRNQSGDILVSETYGKTIVVNAIARRLNGETKQRGNLGLR